MYKIVKNIIKTFTGLLYTPCPDRCSWSTNWESNKKQRSKVSEILDFIMEFVSVTLKTNSFDKMLTVLLAGDPNNIIKLRPTWLQFFNIRFTEDEMKSQWNKTKFNRSKNIGKENMYIPYAIVRYLESNKPQN